MDLPSFSIVVPTFQRREVVGDAVRAIARIQYSGTVDLIVVVDGSTDGTAAALAGIDCPFPFRIVEQPNLGAAAARNRGAALATGEILLFLDDDMMCQPDIIEQHAKSYRDGADAVLGDIPLDPASPPGFLGRSIGNWSAQRTRTLSTGAPLSLYDLLTGHLSIRRSVFEDIGGFDERFTAGGTFGNEDVDIGVRLLERYDVRFNPAALSHQRYVVTPRRHLRQWFEAGKADVAFALKHPDRAQELFELHGGSSRMARVMFKPIARVPLLPRILGGAGAILAQLSARAPASFDPLFSRFYDAARDVQYWAGVRSASRAQGGQDVLVLCYHAIADLRSDPVLSDYGIKPAEFERQIDDLRLRGCNFIGAQDLEDFLETGAPLPEQPILLSFDDCYAELPEVARTILKPRGIPALAFAVSGMTSSTNEWDQAIGARRMTLLSLEQLRELPKLGVEVGCHSRSHHEMPKLGETELVEETDGAAEDLKAIGLPRPRYFAYPYGEVDARSKGAVSAAGFSAAFGLAPHRVNRTTDRFNLPRVEILARDSQWRFWLKTRWPKLAATLT